MILSPKSLRSGAGWVELADGYGRVSLRELAPSLACRLVGGGIGIV